MGVQLLIFNFAEHRACKNLDLLSKKKTAENKLQHISILGVMISYLDAKSLQLISLGCDC